MRVRVLDLDGAISSQGRLLNKLLPEVHDLRRWGSALRFACRWSRFYRFERWLDRILGGDNDREPAINLLGSGDFHHLSLALLRRVRRPMNLLVLDRHPDWMRGLPFVQAANWLRHASQLPNVKRIFLVGGEQGYEGPSRWFAPRSLLQSGKIVVLPTARSFQGGLWSGVSSKPLRAHPDDRVQGERLEELLLPYLEDLERWPLYVSLDKNVMWLPESVVNGRSGSLDLTEVQEILDFFLKTAGNDLGGMDVVGDWSPVQPRNFLLSLLTAPTGTGIDANQARLCNERTNLVLLRHLLQEPVPTSGFHEMARR